MDKQKIEYVYILTNNEFKGKIKIGRTDKHPEIRVEQLNKQTGTIGKYKCEFFVETKSSEIAEKLMHYIFEEVHYDKEFFNASVDLAKKVLEKVNEQFYYLYYIKLGLFDNKDEVNDLMDLYNEMIVDEDTSEIQKEEWSLLQNGLKLGLSWRK